MSFKKPEEQIEESSNYIYDNFCNIKEDNKSITLKQSFQKRESPDCYNKSQK